jgi:hypothetical protein
MGYGLITTRIHPRGFSTTQLRGAGSGAYGAGRKTHPIGSEELVESFQGVASDIGPLMKDTLQYVADTLAKSRRQVKKKKKSTQ